MGRRTRWIKRRALVLAVAAVGVVAIAGTALAGHQTSAVKSYTGCLVSGDGVIIKVKEGNAPRSACTGGQVEAHFSGGDITKISVGDGLVTVPSDGANGNVRIELAAGQALPQSCAAGRVAEWNGSAWVCGVDNDTTYEAGTGLDLDTTPTPDEFEIEPKYRVPGKSCSTDGEFAKGFDSTTGAIQCEAPAASQGVQAYQKRAGKTNLPKGEGVDLIIMPLRAGTYLITAVATVRDHTGSDGFPSIEGGDEEVSVRCFLRNGAFASLPVADSFVDIGEESGDGPSGSAVVHGAVTLTSDDSVRFTCLSSGGDDEREEADGNVMTAVKIGTLVTP
jgi:hypothetical protein